MNYFDLHCDTISECYKQKIMLDNNHLQISLKKGKNIDKWIQVYAVWIDDVMQGEEAYDHFNEVHQYFLQQLEYNKEQIRLCVSPKVFENCLSNSRRIAILAIEGSRALGGKLSRVEEFYQKGVRLMTLTWNGRSEVGDGCMVKNATGLTEFGVQVVTKMQEIGMLVDVSHLCEEGFWQVVEITRKPFVATHSNSKAICNHPRNLTDKQFSIFVERKGLVGMNFYPTFINGKKHAHVKELLPHIDHFIELGGENVIAMGSDFDGAKMPSDLKNISEIDRLYQILIKRYGKVLADKFFYENSYRFFKENIE